MVAYKSFSLPVGHRPDAATNALKLDVVAQLVRDAKGAGEGADGAGSWQLVTTSACATVHRRKLPGQPVTQVRARVAVRAPARPADVFRCLYDPPTRMSWDESLLSMDVVEAGVGGDFRNDVVAARLGCPFPLANRETLCNRWGGAAPNTLCPAGSFALCWLPCQHPGVPARKSCVRGWSFGAYVVEPAAGGPGAGCELYIFLQSDPGGAIPKWCVNRFMPKAALKSARKLANRAQELATERVLVQEQRPR